MAAAKDPWKCAWCGRVWPVPLLAEECETKHLEAEPARTEQITVPGSRTPKS